MPGHTVVTTLDLHLQDAAEKALEAKAKRGAIVIMDPNNGDILAMASWPTYDPNVFIPNISAEKFKELQDDPNIPLLPRAFRSSYPPGSTFKVAVGIAALESGTIRPDDQFDCPPAIQVGNLTFHNWKKTGRGALNFVEALTESCDTWFYQVGMKTGAEPIVDWALKLGFGAKCGIPLRGEVEGRVPNDQYMKATHGRKLLNGDIANLSIGQGDSSSRRCRWRKRWRSWRTAERFIKRALCNRCRRSITKSSPPIRCGRKKRSTPPLETMRQLHTGMVDAVSGGAGTAHQANLENVDVAGKTGTAQWGPKIRNARRHGSQALSRPNTRNMHSRPFTRVRWAAKCTAEQRRTDDRDDPERRLQAGRKWK